MKIVNRFSLRYHPEMDKKNVTEMQKEDRHVVLATRFMLKKQHGQ